MWVRPKPQERSAQKASRHRETVQTRPGLLRFQVLPSQRDWLRDGKERLLEKPSQAEEDRGSAFQRWKPGLVNADIKSSGLLEPLSITHIQQRPQGFSRRLVGTRVHLSFVVTTATGDSTEGPLEHGGHHTNPQSLNPGKQ